MFETSIVRYFSELYFLLVVEELSLHGVDGVSIDVVTEVGYLLELMVEFLLYLLEFFEVVLAQA